MSIIKIRGFDRLTINISVVFIGFKYVIHKLIKREISLTQTKKFFKRSMLFSKITKGNKYISIDGKKKIDIYLPGLGTKAHQRAMDKLLVIDKKMPCSSALISITSACRNRCDFCYQKLDKGKDLKLEILTDTVTKLIEKGVSFFTIQGGDPFLAFGRLKSVVEVIGDSAEVWVNSTGDGVTLERLEILKTLNVSVIMFSLHSDTPEEFNTILKNSNAWENMIKGIELCHKAGLGVAFNITLFKDDYYNGKFQRVLERAKEFGACYIQMIKPKPSGDWLDHQIDEFTSEDLIHIKKLTNRYNLNKNYRDYPSIWSQFIHESRELFGCIAGGTERLYLNAKGDIQPCEFLNISMGNLNNEDFDTIYNRVRKEFHTPCVDMLCETCAKSIHREFIKGKHSTLPLDMETSLKLIKTWNKGEKTPFYEKVK